MASNNNMKRLSALLVTISLLATTNVGVVHAQYLLTYENPTHGIQIKYFSNWKIEEPEDSQFIRVLFRSPLESGSQASAGMFIGVLNLPAEIPLDQYTDKAIDILKATFVDFELIDSSLILISDILAQKILFTGKSYNIESMGMVVVTIKEEKAYFLMYIGEPEKYSDYLPAAQKMINSFKIIESKTIAPIEFLTYEDLINGITIKYPDNWEVIEIPSEYDFVISFNSPPEKNSDVDVEVINVVIEPIPEGLTLDEYTQSEIDLLGFVHENLAILESSPTTLAGSPAHKIVYTGILREFDEPSKGMEVWTIKNDIAYLVGYYAGPDTYDNYLETAQKMLESFEILPTKIISGKYLVPNAGLQIELPEGWSGIETYGNNKTLIVVSPGITYKLTGEVDAVYMEIFVGDLLELRSLEVSSTPTDESGCVMPTPFAIINLNGMKAGEMLMECEGTEMMLPMKMKELSLATEEKTISVTFSASSDTVYESNIAKFEESLKTLRIENTIDLSDPSNAPLFGLTLSKEIVMVDNKPYDIEIVSNSRVMDFSFSEDNKQISFKVEAKDGSEGFSRLYIGEVLEGPYTVTIDGKPLDDVMPVEDKTNGETSVDLIYEEGVHDITMIGTQVVPEFSLLILAIFATAVSLIFATRLMPRINKMKINFDT